MGHSQDVVLVVENKSSKTIRLTQYWLRVGKFHAPNSKYITVEPKCILPPNSKQIAFYSCGSRLEQQGTEGWVKFGVDGGGLVCTFSWGCPVLSSKWATVEASDGWNVDQTGGDFVLQFPNAGLGTISLSFSMREADTEELERGKDGASEEQEQEIIRKHKELQEQFRKSTTRLLALEESENCIACMEERRTMMYRPCGHVPFCADCCRKHTRKECPMCMQLYTETIGPVYF